MIRLSRGCIFPVDKSHIWSHYFLLADGITISKVRWKELHSIGSYSNKWYGPERADLEQNTCCWRSIICAKGTSGVLLQMRSKRHLQEHIFWFHFTLEEPILLFPRQLRGESLSAIVKTKRTCFSKVHMFFQLKILVETCLLISLSNYIQKNMGSRLRALSQHCNNRN